jgi:hypothetical protein
MQYEIGQKVWVKCQGTNVYGSGVVMGFTKKRIKCTNEGSGDDRIKAYSYNSVMPRDRD